MSFAKLFEDGDNQVLARLCMSNYGAPKIIIHFGPDGNGEFDMRYPNTEAGHAEARAALAGMTAEKLAPFMRLNERDPFAA